MKNMDLFNKLASQEKDFFASQIFSPVLNGNPIRVCIAGVIVNLVITQPKNFEGWGVFAPLSYKTARRLRAPGAAEKQQYFDLFPDLNLILCRKNGNQWVGIPANKGGTRFKIEGLVPVQLTEEVQMFDIVKARFDGSHVWFEQIDPRADLRIPIYLREQLVKLTEPKDIAISGLTQEQISAYAIAYAPALEADLEAKRDKNEDRIKDALVRAGARYQGYVERGDTYTIEYFVENERHRSVVKKDNLAIVSAGICLAGTDRNFDLQSLVGVIKQGQRGRRIVRVGNNREFGDGSGYEQADYDSQIDDDDY